ncbi:MAG: hypothetical protein HC824_06800 [Synechococcales cyanobacterium RM1_1_8]|nr:hypothetical protein [Synechococcales cyanobacterium RM1_1_8]
MQLAQDSQAAIPLGYRSQAEDTSAEVDRMAFALLRQRSPQQRLQSAAALMRSARQFSLNCFQQRFAHLSESQFARKVAEAWLQEHCPPQYVPTGSSMTWIQDSIQLAAQLHPLFESLEIPYYVTGGVAAIAYGESRTTQDLDVVIAVQRSDIPRLALALEVAGFYVPGMDDAVSGRMRSLQVTETATISRADLMIADLENATVQEYEQLKFERRQAYSLREDLRIYLASPEDLVVNKLHWGQQSQSQKQWRDVLGILKTQQELLDFEYIYRWAKPFELWGLVQQACLEAGVGEIAAQQWAVQVAPVLWRAFAIAQERQRTIQVSPGLEVAEGRLYRLTFDQGKGQLSVLALRDDREVVCVGRAGRVILANPALGDRAAWAGIRDRLKA